MTTLHHTLTDRSFLFALASGYEKMYLACFAFSFCEK